MAKLTSIIKCVSRKSKKMRYTILSLFLLLFMASCGSNSSLNVEFEDQNKETQINQIKSLNNEMLKLFLETGRNTSSLSSDELIKFKTDLSVKRMELINLNLNFTIIFLGTRFQLIAWRMFKSFMMPLVPI